MSNVTTERTTSVESHRHSLAAAVGRRALQRTCRPRICKRPIARGRWKCPCSAASSLSVRQGEFLAIVGQSGCGKTTLLHLLGTLDAPDSGEIHFEGQRIDNLPSHRRDCAPQPPLRHDLSVLSSAAGDDDAGERARPADDHARRIDLLAAAAAIHRAGRRTAGDGRSGPSPQAPPRELSGGEMQRVAIARSLISRPSSCWPTSRRAISTRKAGGRSSGSCAGLNQRHG